MSRRVTVVGTRRRLDADLPDSIPVAELLPDVAGLLGENANGAAVAWGLLRVGGDRLDVELSLADQDVADGTMLFLRDVTSALPAPAIDDFAGRVAILVDAEPGRWRADMPAALLAWIAGASLAAAGLAVLLLGDASARATAGVIGAAVSGLGAFVLVRLVRRPVPAAVVMFGGLPAWVAAGAGMAGLAGAGIAMQLGFGLAGASLGALAALAILGKVAYAFAVGVLEATVGPAIVVAGTSAFGGGVIQAVAILAPVEVVGLALVPALNARLVGATAEEEAALAGRLAGGRSVQAASLIASAVVIVASSAVLATSGGWFARGLVVTTAVASVLRARHYRFAAEVAPLLGAGVASLLLLEVPFAAWLAVGVHGAAGLAVLLIADAIVLVGAASLVRSWSLPPQVNRWLRPLESLTVAATVPFALGVLGAYDAVIHFARGLG